MLASTAREGTQRGTNNEARRFRLSAPSATWNCTLSPQSPRGSMPSYCPTRYSAPTFSPPSASCPMDHTTPLLSGFACRVLNSKDGADLMRDASRYNSAISHAQGSHAIQ